MISNTKLSYNQLTFKTFTSILTSYNDIPDHHLFAKTSVWITMIYTFNSPWTMAHTCLRAACSIFYISEIMKCGDNEGVLDQKSKKNTKQKKTNTDMYKYLCISTFQCILVVFPRHLLFCHLYMNLEHF